MNDRDDRAQPLDHLPPQEERDDAAEAEEQQYPGASGAPGGSQVSPETAAEPEKPNRHGVHNLPSTPR